MQVKEVWAQAPLNGNCRSRPRWQLRKWITSGVGFVSLTEAPDGRRLPVRARTAPGYLDPPLPSLSGEIRKIGNLVKNIWDFETTSRLSDDLVVETRTGDDDRWRRSQSCLTACCYLSLARRRLPARTPLAERGTWMRPRVARGTCCTRARGMPSQLRAYGLRRQENGTSVSSPVDVSGTHQDLSLEMAHKSRRIHRLAAGAGYRWLQGDLY
jgi:hypothetical protein